MHLCMAWYALDVFFTTSTIMHLTVIAVDRYVALRHPLRYNATRSRRHTCCKIAFVWIFALVLAGPYFVFARLLGVSEEQQVSLKGCGPEGVVFVLPAVIFSFYIPFGVMTFTCLQTVRMLRRRTKQDLFKQIPSVRITAPQESDSTEFSHNDVILTDVRRSSRTSELDAKRFEETSLTSNFSDASERRASTTLQSSQPSSMLQRKHAHFSNKAIKVLCVLYTVFTFCYLPFFLSITARALCKSDRCAPLDTVSHVFELLGYGAAVLNPIVYNVFSKQFRTAFYRLIRCR